MLGGTPEPVARVEDRTIPGPAGDRRRSLLGRPRGCVLGNVFGTIHMHSKLVLTSASAAVALLAAGCGGSTPSTSSASPSPSSAATGTTIAVATNATMGQILVDGRGMTVYLFVADTTTAATCNNQLDFQSNGQTCAQVWPPVLTTGAPRAGAGAEASILGTTMRSDGKIQVTYAGHPLYYFVADYAPGLATGQGINGFGALWWVVTSSGAAKH